MGGGDTIMGQIKKLQSVVFSHPIFSLKANSVNIQTQTRGRPCQSHESEALASFIQLYSHGGTLALLGGGDLRLTALEGSVQGRLAPLPWLQYEAEQRASPHG